MLIQYMYVDILFPPSKVIPIVFEHVNAYYQILQTRIGNNATRYHTRYHTFTVSLVWFEFICIELPRVTVKFMKNIFINIF